MLFLNKGGEGTEITVKVQHRILDYFGSLMSRQVRESSRSMELRVEMGEADNHPLFSLVCSSS